MTVALSPVVGHDDRAADQKRRLRSAELELFFAEQAVEPQRPCPRHHGELTLEERLDRAVWEVERGYQLMGHVESYLARALAWREIETALRKAGVLLEAVKAAKAGEEFDEEELGMRLVLAAGEPRVDERLETIRGLAGHMAGEPSGEAA